MMRRVLKLLSIVLVAALCGMGKSPPKKSAGTPSVSRTLMQMERDWVDAGAKRDTKTVDRILADDWFSVDFRGKTVTKAQAMAELKSGASAQTIELGPMKVKVFGDTAVVTGTDSSGTYAWMDIFMKRNGHWQAVASQSTKIEK